ncbi:MAG: D-alanyl-D-alanine carboxypeptidase/D-alanyl-D-alanine-endopeptidase [Betaproteobacteria bacterium]
MLLLLGACVSPTTVQSVRPVVAGLPTSVINMLATANIPQDAVGAVVIRATDGVTILAHRPNASMQPASTLKTLTSIVGLERLGPTYRGRTELRSGGELVSGASGDLTLRGDLVLRGLGNPDLDWEAFQRLLQALRHKGISEISGDLVLDRQWFQPSRPDLGVPPFDETPEFRYNVIPDALLLNSNLLQLDFESGDQEKTLGMRIGMSPNLERVTVVSNMKFIERACDKWEDGWILPTVSRDVDGGIRIDLQGEFPKKCSASTSINVLDRVDFADRLFRTLWRNLGGTFSGKVRETMPSDASPVSMRLLAQQQSRTLAEFTRDINKRSDNPIARLLYLSLGALSTAENNLATAARADVEVRSWLNQHAIDDAGLVLENGSGLSRSERIRPTQLAAVLKAAYQSDWAPEFMASLPIVAVDGGMRNRLRASTAAGHARIKTGSLRDVAAVAGFVTDANNELCIVVVMINHPLATGAVARPILDAVIDWVTRNPAVDSTQK